MLGKVGQEFKGKIGYYYHCMYNSGISGILLKVDATENGHLTVLKTEAKERENKRIVRC